MVVPVATQISDVEANVPSDAVDAQSNIILQGQLFSKKNCCDKIRFDVIIAFLCFGLVSFLFLYVVLLRFIIK